MRAKLNFQKSLKLLDFGKIERGESCLRETIEMAELEGDEVTLGGALCCLGEFLYLQDRTDEAVPLFERTISLTSDEIVLHVIHEEIQQAKEFLRRIRNE